MVEAYFAAWKSDGASAAPLIGAQRHVFVAETDAEAVAVARGAYRRWYESLTHLWRQFGTLPARFAESLDRALEIDAAIVGSPATVRAEVERHLTTSGCNYFVGRFVFGDLPGHRARVAGCVRARGDAGVCVRCVRSSAGFARAIDDHNRAGDRWGVSGGAAPLPPTFNQAGFAARAPRRYDVDR
ncbi:MAG: hypothetical protein HYR51_03335 [Candidatus Rokubacteria bacterium]|nr:hypothetical protein [Candidatus Rokubacteria bacterium]